MNQIMLERRQFLQAGGALVVGFALAPIAPALAQQAARGAFPLRDVTDDAVNSFLAIAPDGQVTLYSGRVDLGTGLRAAYRQIVAEELDVPYERIVMIDGDTALTPDQGGTGGSTAIVTAGMEVRQAAATARQALLKLASERLSVPVEQLSVADGVVRANNGRTVAYGDLVGGKRFDIQTDTKAPLKNAAPIQICRQVAAAARSAREDDRAAHVRARFQAAEHAARARHPAHVDRRNARRCG